MPERQNKTLGDEKSGEVGESLERKHLPRALFFQPNQLTSAKQLPPNISTALEKIMFANESDSFSLCQPRINMFIKSCGNRSLSAGWHQIMQMSNNTFKREGVTVPDWFFKV